MRFLFGFIAALCLGPGFAAGNGEQDPLSSKFNSAAENRKHFDSMSMMMMAQNHAFQPSPTCWFRALRTTNAADSGVASSPHEPERLPQTQETVLNSDICSAITYTQQQLLALELTRCHMESFGRAIGDEKLCKQNTLFDLNSLRACLASMNNDVVALNAFTHFFTYVNEACMRLTQELVMAHHHKTALMLTETSQIAAEKVRDAVARMEGIESMQDGMLLKYREQLEHMLDQQGIFAETSRVATQTLEEIESKKDEILANLDEQVKKQKEELRAVTKVIEIAMVFFQPLSVISPLVVQFKNRFYRLWGVRCLVQLVQNGLHIIFVTFINYFTISAFSLLCLFLSVIFKRRCFFAIVVAELSTEFMIHYLEIDQKHPVGEGLPLSGDSQDVQSIINNLRFCGLIFASSAFLFGFLASSPLPSSLPSGAQESIVKTGDNDENTGYSPANSYSDVLHDLYPNESTEEQKRRETILKHEVNRFARELLQRHLPLPALPRQHNFVSGEVPRPMQPPYCMQIAMGEDEFRDRESSSINRGSDMVVKRMEYSPLRRPSLNGEKRNPAESLNSKYTTNVALTPLCFSPPSVVQFPDQRKVYDSASIFDEQTQKADRNEIFPPGNCSIPRVESGFHDCWEPGSLEISTMNEQGKVSEQLQELANREKTTAMKRPAARIDNDNCGSSAVMPQSKRQRTLSEGTEQEKSANRPITCSVEEEVVCHKQPKNKHM